MSPRSVPIQRSIAARLLVLAFGAYLLLTAVLTGAHMWAEYRSVREGVMRSLDSLENTVNPGLATAIYNVDKEQILSIAFGLQSSPDVVAVRITTQYQGTFGSGETPNASVLAASALDDRELTQEAQGYFWRSKPIMYKDALGESYQAGRISLFSSDAVVFDRVWRGFAVILANAAIAAAALWAIFFFLSRRLLVRPLAALTEAAARVDMENLREIHVDMKTGGRDELKILEEAFNGMIVRLRDSREALAKAEENYRSIFENALEGIFQTTSGGRLLRANAAMANMLGYASAEELLAMATNVGEQLYANSSDRSELLNAAREGREIVNREIEFRKKDGERFWAAISMRGVGDPHSPDYFLEGSMTDVTERRELDETMRRAKDEAEAASRLKSEFLSVVSHELRTPMTSVLGFAKIIRKKLETSLAPAFANLEDKQARDLEKVKGNLDIIIAEGQRLTYLINDVLDLTKLEAGKVEWRTEPVALLDVAAQAVASMEVLAGRKGLALSLESGGGPPPMVMGDRDRLLQVVINLISNAVKFTDRGFIACRVDVSGNEAKVTVRDTGLGVLSAYRERIFDKFSQIGEALGDRPKGSGLGLSICREIIERHGGRIWVESPHSGGSAFIFTLPVMGEEDALKAPL